MSIRANYEKELRGVTDNLVLMCRYIESSIEKCVKAFTESDLELAKEIYEDDKIVDKLEYAIEQSCLKILLMENPVARDFREVSAALKMITDLERISDQTWDIAEITIQLGTNDTVKSENIITMAAIVTQMIKDSIQAYINKDIELARSLDKVDDKVDDLFKLVLAEQKVLYVMIAKYFERIGDHAVNIGEWVEYAITGKHPKKGIL
jgi:phosphate transport system protein